ncbi:MAG: hypothetical protein OXN44_08285 [Acidimicrobiaceae bacterium]|nr:hypothetical protein [Acidimicrobiaceae bacterium]
MSLPENEFVDRYGFGISTTLDEWFDAQVRFAAATAQTRDGRQVLSTEGRRAWDAALFGPEVDTVPETGQLIDPLTGTPTNDISVSLDTGEGCAFEASHEVVGNFVILDPLQAAYDDMEDRLAADPRMIALKRGWSECMRASGNFSFTEPLDARALVAEMALPYREAYQVALQPESGGSGPTFTSEELNDLGTIQDFERLLAASDLACRSERDDPAARLVWEYESELVREHRELIDEFRNSSMSEGLTRLADSLGASLG